MMTKVLKNYVMGIDWKMVGCVDGVGLGWVGYVVVVVEVCAL